MKTSKILLNVSGSIAAFKAATLASLLIKKGYEVKCVMTKSALDFLGVGTLEGITGNPVQTELFADGERMDHISLARWADLQILYPASAESISKLSHGSAIDLLSTLFLAHNKEKPYFIAPAMNPEMMSHPAVLENLEKCKRYGAEILNPESGRMACGEVGVGRLIEPEVAFKQIVEKLENPKKENETALKGKKIIITAGGTFEPLDQVRGLTNISTGVTGIKISEALQDSGAEVTLLLSNQGGNFFQPNVKKNPIQLIHFKTFEDLEEKLFKELQSNLYDVCIHSAAVSDFKVDSIETSSGILLNQKNKKISSDENIIIKLVKRHKIVSFIKQKSLQKNIKLISFKLSAEKKNREDEIKNYSFSDAVIHNYADEIDRTSDLHKVQMFIKKNDQFKFYKETQTKSELMEMIKGVIKNDFSA